MTLILVMLGLGIASAVMPCPLATNIAAVSFLMRQVSSAKASLSAALLYTFGRILAYVMIGLIMGLGLSFSSSFNYFLQNELPIYMGPLLCIAALILMDIIPFPSIGKKTDAFQKESTGLLSTCVSALGMGFLFALALCPSSAAILFLNVIPTAAQHDTSGLVTGLTFFGIGTALPVVVIALLIIFSLRHAQALMKNIVKAQPYIKMGTGIILLLIGIYYICENILFVS